MWWIDPAVTIAAFAWLGVGVVRYRAADDRRVAQVQHAAPELVSSTV